MEEVKYFLVLEKRPGDYNIIDIAKLDICDMVVTSDLGSIDLFTSKFSESEIKDAITRSNIVRPEYLEGTLKIISDHHHRLDIMTKDIFQVIMEFQISNDELDRDFKNKLYGYYKKIVESTFNDNDFIKGMLDRFKESLKKGEKEGIFAILLELPYPKSRTIYQMIYHEIDTRKKENLRKLEKPNDNE